MCACFVVFVCMWVYAIYGFFSFFGFQFFHSRKNRFMKVGAQSLIIHTLLQKSSFLMNKVYFLSRLNMEIYMNFRKSQ